MAQIACLIAPTQVIAAGEGRVSFFASQGTDTDHFFGVADSAGPGPARDFLISRYSRSLTYDFPAGRRWIEWYPNAWLYKDAYGLQASDVGGPMWRYVLRDPEGRPMHLDYACGSDGACPQFALDITSAGYRAAWIAELRERQLRPQHRGVFVDDVNFDRLVCSDVGAACSAAVTPVGADGRAVTAERWQVAMARFMRDIREAFPGKEIVHNQRYLQAGGLSGGMPVSEHVRSAIEQADLIEVEGSYNDGGLVPGGGRFGWDTLRSWIGYIHARGKGVVHDQGAPKPEYALATYLMDATGRDYIGHVYRRVPGDWWTEGWELDLGSARGPAFADQGVVRRDFENGLVLVRKPGSAPGPVALEGQHQRLDGTPAGSVVSVPPAGGLVLRTASADGDPAFVRFPGGAPLDPF